MTDNAKLQLETLKPILLFVDKSSGNAIFDTLSKQTYQKW